MEGVMERWREGEGEEEVVGDSEVEEVRIEW